jgi:hypothetical protein
MTIDKPDPLTGIHEKDRPETSPTQRSLRHVLSLNTWLKRLLLAAALLHIMLTVGLHVAGRTQITPNLIDPDGIMPSFASDSYTYRQPAIFLSAVLKEQGIRAWLAEGEPVHIKLISLLFALFGSIFGYTPLSVELLNLCCYLCVVSLVFAIGKELAGERAGLIAAVTVGFWPSFLLHTTQLLKEPLFISGGLAFILIVTTTLTRTYTKRTAAIVSLITVLFATLLLRIRFQLGLILLAAVGFGLLMLVVRQILERRLLFWNAVCPVLVLVAGALSPLYMAAAVVKHKQFEPAQIGPLKRVAAIGQFPSKVNDMTSGSHKNPTSAGSDTRLPTVFTWAMREIFATRHNYNVDVLDAGSAVDQNVEFRSVKDVVSYLPRAFALGMWSPFPNTWLRTGKHVGRTGTTVAGAETAAMYLFQLLALAGVIIGRRRIASVLLLLFTVFGVTMLGLVVSNVGTLYRLRYIFWILLIVLAAKGVYELAVSLMKHGSVTAT